jgi:hypothetical protein
MSNDECSWCHESNVNLCREQPGLGSEGREAESRALMMMMSCFLESIDKQGPYLKGTHAFLESAPVDIGSWLEDAKL